MIFWDFKRSPASVDLLVGFGAELGLSASALLRGSGISIAQLSDPNVELAAVKELKVIANLVKLSGAPSGLGLQVGLRYRITTYGLWGYGLISSATAADALAMALRYLPLTYLFNQILYRRQAGVATMHFDAPDFTDDLRRFVIERDMAAAAALMGELVGDGFALTRLQLQPEERGKAGRRLFGVEPVYAASSNQLSFDASLLARRLPGANPITAALCEQLCAELLRRRTTQASTSDVIRQYLEIPGASLPDLATMARHLNTSERTLKRRLQGEGTSFRLLIENRRRAWARELLREGELSVSAIAERLGFADVSSFSQAHKRWHGVSPKARRPG
ncbi:MULTISPECIES: AraC family transcriptional regulator [Hydrocarboniphaga]|uniref:HTH araC/xylS-type domain-containing protein n=1 Tax=Hydrocarboniphaga effusa AP103 TaxID=1172194 RepID=I8T2K9_9GAMM|nr:MULTISPECIES: AraC family transcriptional regulator [Hydrocarboniphaga]EIT67908.1 hypothetical protein WQQ_43430 [Hydrocarboniphaga effusa AP103]MDZ4079949.1 AraC family transcriptional regulator [Hydrocarboniphaga sp.]